jgi:hypothetical protein
VAKAPTAQKVAPISVNGGDEIVEMDRMRKFIVVILFQCKLRHMFNLY